MNYTEMLFNRDERLVNLLNQADSKNLELIEEINNREDEIERLNENNQAMQEEMARIWEKLDKKENIIKEIRDKSIQMVANNSLDFMYRQAYKDILEMLDKD